MRLMLQTESHSEQCWHKLSVTTQGTAVNATADPQIKDKALFVLFVCNCHWSQRFYDWTLVQFADSYAYL